ncbi:MAG: DUF1330 domain-containing protein [Nitratireductor sp.]|nr:DUF1330 domain-containing protein [Nitratireductor sp.]
MEEKHVDPDRERFARFKDLPRDHRIHMLNLVRLKETATYDDGMMVTGREAYSAYSRESAPIFQRLGGRIVWSGSFELMLIGPESERWDLCFIAEYPDAEAFITMIRDPEYQKAVRHRQAAVLTSRLIRMKPGEAGHGFG